MNAVNLQLAGSQAPPLNGRSGRRRGLRRVGVADTVWLHRLSVVNRRQLLAPPANHLAVAEDGRYQRWLRLVSTGFGAFGAEPRFGYHWPVALNALGAEWAHRATDEAAEWLTLSHMFASPADQEIVS